MNEEKGQFWWVCTVGSSSLKTFCHKRPVLKTLLKTLWSLVMDWVQQSQGNSHYEETVYFLALSLYEFLVPMWLTAEGWKAELTLEPPSGIKPRTPGLKSSTLTIRPLTKNVFGIFGNFCYGTTYLWTYLWIQLLLPIKALIFGMRTRVLGSPMELCIW